MQSMNPIRCLCSPPVTAAAFIVLLSLASIALTPSARATPPAEKPQADAAQRLDYREASPSAVHAISELTKFAENSGLEAELLNLVFLRASQLNGCDFCLVWHASDAHAIGMDEQRINSVSQWRESQCYTDREKAALGWTEAVTLVAETHVPDEVYETAKKHFSEKELVDLTTAIIAVNGWNRLNIAFGTPIVCDVPSVDAKPATAEMPQPSVRILREDKYEGKMDGKDTTVSMIEVTLPPLAEGSPHRHPGPVSGYVIEGTYEFQAEGGPLQRLKAGDTFFEPAMILHKVSRNPDREKRARVLATMVRPTDVESLTIRDPIDEQTQLRTKKNTDPALETCAVPAAPGKPSVSTASPSSLANAAKPTALVPNLPIVGLLLYDGVLQTEITAPSDVFSKRSEDGEKLFNVITIAASYELVTTEEGLRLFPDYTFDNSPKLDVIVVPSSFEMAPRVKDEPLLRFIRNQDKDTQYTVSNCGGAALIGASGIAKGKKIVTWVGGGNGLQENYPELKVQDDAKVSFVEDGKLLSSNGNLASYISALELLEKMSGKEHRKFVESHLYLERLQNWKKQ